MVVWVVVVLVVGVGVGIEIGDMGDFGFDWIEMFGVDQDFFVGFIDVVVFKMG